MSELTYTVLRLGLLVLLWVFVLSVVGVLRRDLFGTRALQRTPAPARSRPGSRGAQPTGAPREAAPTPPAQEERAGPGSVTVVEGPSRGTSVTLASSPVLVGRSPECTLVLSDDYASSRHARLFPQDGRWWVEDLGSTNGTQVGDAQVSEPTPLDVGSRVQVGRSVLELRR